MCPDSCVSQEHFQGTAKVFAGTLFTLHLISLFPVQGMKITLRWKNAHGGILLFPVALSRGTDNFGLSAASMSPTE